jgi:hypothetical protein
MAGLKEVIERKGVFCALYSDRGSHFWLTPKVGGETDRITWVAMIAAGHPLSAEASKETSRRRGTAPFPCNPTSKINPTQAARAQL